MSGFDWSDGILGNHRCIWRGYTATVDRTGDNSWDVRVVRDGEVVFSPMTVAIEVRSSAAGRWLAERVIRLAALDQVKEVWTKGE